MVSDQTVLNLIGRALWDAKPTKTDLQAQQLAFALGYPTGWRVVRTIEKMDHFEKTPPKTVNNPSNNCVEPGEKDIQPTNQNNEAMLNENSNKPDSETKEKAENAENQSQSHISSDSVPPVKTKEGAEPGASSSPGIDYSTEKVDSAPLQTNSSTAKTLNVIVDRIFAGDPDTDCDRWFHHSAAMKAAHSWMEKQAAHEEDSSSPAPTPIDFKGGHMLPRVARFEKGQKVSVYYEGEWFDAKILRRKEHALDGFRYQVFYSLDNSKQSGVPERSIRPKENADDPYQTASAIGLDDTWQAFSQGGNRWKIVSPDGTVYKSKKLALQVFNKEDSTTEGDPPWRKEDSEYLGKYVKWETKHKASARRTVTVEQIGQVVGWISETDVDKAGEPGFVSEKTGKPANLYHVKFNDEPSRRPYGNILVEFVDLEEYELKECILSDDEYRPKKKTRMG